jgi:predicted XRE-type DNA-binding protein
MLAFAPVETAHGRAPKRNKEKNVDGMTHAMAVKRELATEIERCMRSEGLSKPRMAQRMGTSRSQLDRVLDPKCIAIQLDTLVRAALAVGRNLEIPFRSRPPSN